MHELSARADGLSPAVDLPIAEVMGGGERSHAIVYCIYPF